MRLQRSRRLGPASRRRAMAIGMLSCLRVRNLAIIDALELDLSPGLNVVTGETGAGKSILVSALQLVLGARGSADLVRTGAKTAEVEALFEIEPNDALRQRLAAEGIDATDELVIRRVVHATGRTRAYINGKLATANQLAQLATGLADISSQHEHHSLIDPRAHLDYLDAFGSLLEHRRRVAAAFAEVGEKSRAVEALRTAYRERADREDLLRFQVGEIEELAPTPGEFETLQHERERLRHAHKLATTAASAEQSIYAMDRSLSEQLATIATSVERAAEIDVELQPMSRQLNEAVSLLEDVASSLGQYARALRVDPARLQEVEDRSERLRRLLRKYGQTVEDVLAHLEQAQRDLDRVERFDEELEAAQEALAKALANATKLARSLRSKRQTCAVQLGRLISDELSSLGMGDARVEVELAPLEGNAELQVDGARLSATGIDRAEFLIAPNKGEPARPLRRIASGGELSRSMLAIKRVLAGLAPAGLYVFDEVDSGVGGAVAEVIGRKLVEVSRHHQVLCITHLPQIAVFGGTHFRVAKRVDGDRTFSMVTALTAEQRLEEVARMVGGVKITQRTRDAAAEMLNSAAR